MTRLLTNSLLTGTVLLGCHGLIPSLFAQSDKIAPGASDEMVGYHPTWQSSQSTMSNVPGWEPTWGQSPTSPAYGPGTHQQGGFARGFDRFLTPLVPQEASWNSSAFSGHFSGYGQGGDASSPIGVTSVRANSGLWFDRGFDPRMAEVKAGPLYLDFNYLEAIALWSDIDGPFAAGMPDDGFIAMLGLNVTGFIQITSQTYFKAMGTLYYVPTEGDVGFFFGSGGATYAQFEHRFSLGRWDVHFYDNFDVFHGLSYLLSDLSRPAIDLSGLYRVGYEYAFTSSPWKGDNLYFRNIAGVDATTYFAHDFRFRVGYEHWETWVSDNFDRLTPVDHLSAGLFYENNVSWFRPWLIYDGYFFNDFTDAYQHVMLGATLPFRRSLVGSVRAGYAWWDGGVFGQDDSNLVWDVGLTHHINSAWSHTAQTGYSYQMGPLVDDKSFGYYAHYLIRYQPPRGRVSINGLIQWQRQEYDRSQNVLTGLQAQYIINPRSTLDAYAYYFDHDLGDNDTDSWLYRLQYTRSLSQSVLARLIYQYTDYRTTVQSSDFTDHMLMLSLTKYF